MGPYVTFAPYGSQEIHSKWFKVPVELRTIRFAARFDPAASCMTMNMIRELNHLLTASFALLLDVVRFLSLSVRHNRVY
jgi:hypothetical protein